MYTYVHCIYILSTTRGPCYSPPNHSIMSTYSTQNHNTHHTCTYHKCSRYGKFSYLLGNELLERLDNLCVLCFHPIFQDQEGHYTCTQYIYWSSQRNTGTFVHVHKHVAGYWFTLTIDLMRIANNCCLCYSWLMVLCRII